MRKQAYYAIYETYQFYRMLPKTLPSIHLKWIKSTDNNIYNNIINGNGNRTQERRNNRHQLRQK